MEEVLLLSFVKAVLEALKGLQESQKEMIVQVWVEQPVQEHFLRKRSH